MNQAERLIQLGVPTSLATELWRMTANMGAVATAQEIILAARLDAIEAIIAGIPGTDLMGTVTVAETGITTLALSVRKVSVALDGTILGEKYIAIPVSSTPIGYAVSDVVCTADGTLQFNIVTPILTVGSYSIPVRVVRLNT